MNIESLLSFRDFWVWLIKPKHSRRVNFLQGWKNGVKICKNPFEKVIYLINLLSWRLVQLINFWHKLKGIFWINCCSLIELINEWSSWCFRANKNNLKWKKKISKINFYCQLPFWDRYKLKSNTEKHNSKWCPAH